jgi:hypothetical protein
MSKTSLKQNESEITVRNTNTPESTRKKSDANVTLFLIFSFLDVLPWTAILYIKIRSSPSVVTQSTSHQTLDRLTWVTMMLSSKIENYCDSNSVLLIPKEKMSLRILAVEMDRFLGTELVTHRKRSISGHLNSNFKFHTRRWTEMSNRRTYKAPYTFENDLLII